MGIQVMTCKIPDMGKAYTIQKEADGCDSITCLVCGITSYNYNDIRHRYCGNRHEFHDTLEFGVAKLKPGYSKEMVLILVMMLVVSAVVSIVLTINILHTLINGD